MRIEHIYLLFQTLNFKAFSLTFALQIKVGDCIPAGKDKIYKLFV